VPAPHVPLSTPAQATRKHSFQVPRPASCRNVGAVKRHISTDENIFHMRVLFLLVKRRKKEDQMKMRGGLLQRKKEAVNFLM